MKISLAFNSIFGNLEAILFSEKEIIDISSFEDQNFMQSEVIDNFLNQILKKNNLRYRDLDYLIFLNGPGSFIKIRNGISYALGVKFALNEKIGLINVNLFDVYNHKIKTESKNIDGKEYIIFLKGFSDSMFVQYFDNVKAHEFVLKFSEFSNFIKERKALFNQTILFFNCKKIYNQIFDLIKEDSEVKDYLEKNHIIFDQSQNDLIKNLVDFIKNCFKENKKIDESFLKIGPFYLLNPEFKKIK